MVKKRTIYTTSDGKEFDNEKEAKEHDEKSYENQSRSIRCTTIQI